MPEPLPVLPAPEPMPVLLGPVEPGSGVVMEPEPVPLLLGEEGVAPPTVLPVEAPALAGPVVMASSFRHFSRWSPIMARHLLLGVATLPEVLPAVLPVAPPEALPLVSLLALPLMLPPVVAPTLAPVDPEALPPALVCAAATPASAKSAAAVAVLTSFNIIGVPPTRVEGWTTARFMQRMCRARRLACAALDQAAEMFSHGSL